MEKMVEVIAALLLSYFSENILQNRDWKENKTVMTVTSSAVMESNLAL